MQGASGTPDWSALTPLAVQDVQTTVGPTMLPQIMLPRAEAPPPMSCTAARKLTTSPQSKTWGMLFRLLCATSSAQQATGHTHQGDKGATLSQEKGDPGRCACVPELVRPARVSAAPWLREQLYQSTRWHNGGIEDTDLDTSVSACLSMAVDQTTPASTCAWRLLWRRANRTGRLRVVALGDSLTFGAECNDGKLNIQDCSWSSRVASWLRTEFSAISTIDYLNAAVGGQSLHDSGMQQLTAQVGHDSISPPDIIFFDYLANEMAHLMSSRHGQNPYGLRDVERAYVRLFAVRPRTHFSWPCFMRHIGMLAPTRICNGNSGSALGNQIQICTRSLST
jgi:hypothetical protein